MWMLLAYTVVNHLHMHHLDLTAVFLHADFDFLIPIKHLHNNEE